MSAVAFLPLVPPPPAPAPAAAPVLIRYCCGPCGLEGSFAVAQGSDLIGVFERVLIAHKDQRRRCAHDGLWLSDAGGELRIAMMKGLADGA
jgi:hypothetical protein